MEDFLPALPVDAHPVPAADAVGQLPSLGYKSKAEVQQWALATATEWLDNHNTFRTLADLVRLKEALSIMEPLFREAASKEMSGKRDAFYGLELEKRNGATTWDYSNDPTWKQIEKVRKDHEAYLRTLKKPTEVRDEETGEVVTFYPPIPKYGRDVLAVSLK